MQEQLHRNNFPQYKCLKTAPHCWVVQAGASCIGCPYLRIDVPKKNDQGSSSEGKTQ